MNPPPEKSAGFFSWPDRGGRLAIVNMLLWVVVMQLQPGPIFGLALLLSPPVAIWFILPMHSLDAGGIVILCCIIGVNSFPWGYGFSWLILITVERRARLEAQRRAAGQCVACGYDLRRNVSGICPECGYQTLTC